MIRDPFYKDMKNVKKFPPIDQYKHGDYYTGISMRYRDTTANPVLSEEVRTKIKATAKTTAKLDDAHFEEVWGQLEPKLEKSPALCQFILDFDAARSEFFLPWLIHIPKAVLLESAFGFGYDLAGNWRKIPQDDLFYWWVIREPLFVYLRERAVVTANALKGCKNCLFLGAGYVPELRHVGFEPTKEQNFLAYDKDSSIPRTDLMEEVLQLNYRQGNMMDVLSDEQNKGQFDAVVINGVMSYCYQSMPLIIKKAFGLLKPGGKIVFDVQMRHWNLVRTGLVMGWVTDPPMHLSENAESVADVVESAIRNLCGSATSRVYDEGIIFEVKRHD